MTVDVASEKEELLYLPTLNELATEQVDNEVLRGALERIKSRTSASQANYYTKHTSHSRYSKSKSWW